MFFFDSVKRVFTGFFRASTVFSRAGSEKIVSIRPLYIYRDGKKIRARDAAGRLGWDIRCQVHGQNLRRRVYGSREDAARIEAEMYAAASDAPPAPGRGLRDQVSVYMDWIRVNRSPAHWDLQRRGLDRLIEWGGIVSASDITPAALTRFADWLYAQPTQRGGPPSDNTVRLMLSGVRGMTAWMAARGLLASNPIVRVRIARRGPAKSADWLTPDEIRSALDGAANDDDRDAILGLIMLGLRIGEFCAIRPANVVDGRAKKILRVPKEIRKRRETDLDIPLTKAAETHLARAAARSAERGVDRIFSRVMRGRAHHNESRGPAPWDVESMRRALGSRHGAHRLRHTFATWLVAEGVDLLIVQKLMGHKSAKATRIYEHAPLELMRNVIPDLQRYVPVLADHFRELVDRYGDL